MPELSSERFAQRTQEVGLLDERQIEAIWSELGTRSATILEFQSVALRREWLTNYQIEKLNRGDRSGFFYGDYRTLYLVGAGTFARVYRAVHTKTGEVVAIKVLRRRYSDVPEQMQKFAREGRMGKTLRHPGIVPIYHVHSSGTTHYLIMEFVEGHNLREFLKVRKKLSPDEATDLASQLADGLKYAFKKGITHRDIKMTNVLVSSRGKARLVDFGLAATTGRLTDDELVDYPNARTIDYAGLERATGVRKDDKRSDTYFLGCVYYHMLTGQPPLQETKDRIQRLSVSRFRDVEPIDNIEPGLPRWVVSVVKKAMQLNPKNRYQSPEEMLGDLRMTAERLQAREDQELLDALHGDAKLLAEMPTESKATQEEQQATIMLVESNVDMQNILRDNLKRKGFRVLVFSDPDRATSRFDQDDRPADCIVFSTEDLGESAVVAFNQFAVHPRCKNVPAALLLGDHHGDWRKDARVADHRAVIQMPIRLNAFCGIVKKLAERKKIGE